MSPRPLSPLLPQTVWCHQDLMRARGRWAHTPLPLRLNPSPATPLHPIFGGNRHFLTPAAPRTHHWPLGVSATALPPPQGPHTWEGRGYPPVSLFS